MRKELTQRAATRRERQGGDERPSEDSQLKARTVTRKPIQPRAAVHFEEPAQPGLGPQPSTGSGSEAQPPRDEQPGFLERLFGGPRRSEGGQDAQDRLAC